METNPSKSYADVVGKKTSDNTSAGTEFDNFGKIDLSKIQIVDIPLSIRQSHAKDSCYAILFTDLELQRSESVPKFVLMAKFSRGRPSLDSIRAHIHKHWGLLHCPIVGLMDSRHITIRFSNEEDLNRAWVRPQRDIDGALFRLFKWSRDFSVQYESAVAPTWIRLPLLPLNFCVTSYLKAITYPIGKFLAADTPTLTLARPAYARVCVELDLRSKRESKVWIGKSLEEGFWQRIEYERAPKFCNKCRLQGHDIYDCRKIRKIDPKPMNDRPNQVKQGGFQRSFQEQKRFNAGKEMDQASGVEKKEGSVQNCNKETNETPPVEVIPTEVKIAVDNTESQGENIDNFVQEPLGNGNVVVPGHVTPNQIVSKDDALNLEGANDQSRSVNETAVVGGLAIGSVLSPIPETIVTESGCRADLGVNDNVCTEIVPRKIATGLSGSMIVDTSGVECPANNSVDNSVLVLTEEAKNGEESVVPAGAISDERAGASNECIVGEASTEGTSGTSSSKKKKKKKKKAKLKENQNVTSIPQTVERDFFRGNLRELVGDFNLDSSCQVNYNDDSSDNNDIHSDYEGKAAEKYMKKHNFMPFYMVTRGVKIRTRF